MTADAAADPNQGAKLAAISTFTVALFRQYTGRGPSKARTFIDDDMLVVVLQNALTPLELTLVDNDRAEIVLATRKTLQELMSAELIAGVEQRMQRTVTAFLSANHIAPDVAIVTFLLAPAQQQPAPPAR
jgi:uncharacterized protein YbcI